MNEAQVTPVKGPARGGRGAAGGRGRGKKANDSPAPLTNGASGSTPLVELPNLRIKEKQAIMDQIMEF